MITYEEAFRRLGIEPTKDRKVIKQAYAAMAKKYHPEEQPEKWLRIKEAYETALKGYGEKKIRIDHTRKVQVMQSPKSEREIEPLQQAKESESFRQWKEEQEINQLFMHIGEEAERNRQTKKKIQEEQLEEVLRRISELGNEGITDIPIWNHFLSTQEMEILCKNEFLEQLGRTFDLLSMDKELYRFFKRWVKRIKEFSQGVPELYGSTYWESSFSYVQRRLSAAREEYWLKRARPIIWVGGNVIIVLLYVLWAMGIIRFN